MYESRYSEYRRGIPANPRKCWGKNVRLDFQYFLIYYYLHLFNVRQKESIVDTFFVLKFINFIFNREID